MRELRQDASRWLREVEDGATIEVTSRGRPVALLVPVPESAGLDRLIAEGRVTPPTREPGALGEPLPPAPGVPPPSRILRDMRAAER